MSHAYALAAAMRPSADDRAQLRELPSVSTGPTPERLRWAAKAVGRASERLQQMTLAMEAFYSILTPQQRADFDAAPPTAMPTPEALPALGGDLPDPTPEQAQAAITNPDWLTRPTGETIARVYPKRALDACLGGATRVQCTVDVEGFLKDCTVVAAEPAGYGFGNATLQATSYMRMTPQRVYGVPVEGATVTVPLNFQPYPDCKPASPQAEPTRPGERGAPGRVSSPAP